MNQAQKTIIHHLLADFDLFDDWSERYQYILELGKHLPPYPEANQTEQYLVKGCQSQVWMRGEIDTDGILHLQATSDALMVKGLIALLFKVVNGQPAKDLIDFDLGFFEQLGLAQHLSPTRRNGLAAMVNRVKQLTHNA